MTKYEFTVTIGASALNLATQAFAGTAGVSYPAGWLAVYGNATLLATKLSVAAAGGNTGHVYVGNASVSSAGANADYIIDPASTAANSGGRIAVESYAEENTIDLAQYWVHGGVSGDKLVVSFEQA